MRRLSTLHMPSGWVTRSAPSRPGNKPISLLFDATDYRQLANEFGGNLATTVFKTAAFVPPSRGNNFVLILVCK